MWITNSSTCFMVFFKGKLNLNTTSASKVYVNLDIAEVFELIDRFINIYFTNSLWWEVYTVTSVFKSESNKHLGHVADSIQMKQLEAPVSHDETIANDPICTSDIKLLTSLNDVTDANIIDDILGNTQLVRRQKLIINYFIITFLSHNVFLLPLLEV